MLLLLVFQKIFLSEISEPTKTVAARIIARKGSRIMLVTHMLQICRLGTERLAFHPSLTRKLLEGLVTVLRTA